MDKKERDELDNWKARWGACGVCGERFREFDNVGAWKCTQHADEPSGGAYSCCGDLVRPSPHPRRKGCVRADHNALATHPGSPPPRYTYVHDVKLSEAALATLTALSAVEPRAVIRDGGDGYFYKIKVRRFDDPNLELYSR